MILIFDLFETLVEDIRMDFNLGLKPLWEEHYKDKCSFDEIKTYGEELFIHMTELHKQGFEFPFVKDELPMYDVCIIKQRLQSRCASIIA